MMNDAWWVSFELVEEQGRITRRESVTRRETRTTYNTIPIHTDQSIHRQPINCKDKHRVQRPPLQHGHLQQQQPVVKMLGCMPFLTGRLLPVLL